jgi:conjugal transfer mating pair stabilization protein TraG
MYTVYTYWNSEGVIAVLNAIAMFMGTGDYLGLLRTFAIAGMLVAVGVGLVKISAKEPMQYFVFLGLFYFGLFVPKVTVDVVDVQTGGVGTVANVPFGVAFFYSSSSKIGKFLTETYETTFQPVDNLRFGKTGLVFGARAFQEVAGARSGDPRLSDALREFTRGCINPEVIDDTTKYEGLVKAVNIWTYINTSPGGTPWLNQARSVYIPIQGSGSYEYVACQGTGSAYAKLTTWITAEATNQQSWIARKLFPDKATPSTGWGTATAAIAAALADNEGYLLAISRSAADQIKQGMIANAIADSAGSLAAARNDPSAMQASLAAKMAEMQANGAYRSMALIGEAALPKFRNIVEIVIISVFPIVMLLIVMAGERGGAVLKTYVVTTIWIQLWAPLYAIVNFMMLGGMSSRLQAALEGATSQNIMNTAGLTMVAFKEASLAGSLVFAVPVIAYALVKGGEVAMSGAMSGLTGQASGAAASQGGAAATGQVSFGNGSWGNQSSNNMSANKWDTSGSMSQGGWTTKQGQFGTRGSAGAGGSSGDYGFADASGMVANLGAVSGGMQSMVQNSLQKQLATSSALSASQTQSGISNLAAGFEQSRGSDRSSGRDTSVGRSAGVNTQGQSGSNFDWAKTAGTDFGKGLNLSDSQKAALSIGAGGDATARSADLAKVGKDAGGKDTPQFAGWKGALASMVKGGISGMTESGLQQMYHSGAMASDTKAFKDTFGTSTTGTTGTSTDDKSSVSSKQSAGARAQIAQGVQQLSQAAAQAQRTEQATTALASLTSNSGGITANAANAIQAALGGPAGVAALQQLPFDQQVAKVQAAMDQVMSTPGGVALMTGGGATGAPAGRMQAVEDAAGGRTAGAAGGDLAAGGGAVPAPPPPPPVPSGSGAGGPVAMGKKWISSIQEPSSTPSLPGTDGGAPVTPGGVTGAAQEQQARAAAGTAAGQATVAAESGKVVGKVTAEQNSVSGIGGVGGRAGEMAINTIAGAATGQGQGTPGMMTVQSGKVRPPAPPPPPKEGEAGYAAIPTGPISPPPDTPQRKSGKVQDE